MITERLASELAVDQTEAAIGSYGMVRFYHSVGFLFGSTRNSLKSMDDDERDQANPRHFA